MVDPDKYFPKLSAGRPSEDGLVWYFAPYLARVEHLPGGCKLYRLGACWPTDRNRQNQRTAKREDRSGS